LRALEGTLILLSIFWIQKTSSHYFYSAPGDSLVIKVKAQKELDGIYFGKFNERPLLSEVYTKEVVWSVKSDTQSLWYLTFLQSGFFKKNKVSFEILRFNRDSSFINFDTRVVFERKRVLYVDTVWDSVPALYKTWRVLIPALSSSMYGALFDGEMDFESSGEPFMIWVADRSYDDSLRFLFGENFLERRTCPSAGLGRILNVLVVDRKRSDPIRILRLSVNSCERFDLQGGSYSLILENLSNERADLVVRLLKIRLIPKEIKRYKYINIPKREGDTR